MNFWCNTIYSNYSNNNITYSQFTKCISEERVSRSRLPDLATTNFDVETPGLALILNTLTDVGRACLPLVSESLFVWLMQFTDGAGPQTTPLGNQEPLPSNKPLPLLKVSPGVLFGGERGVYLQHLFKPLIFTGFEL